MNRTMIALGAALIAASLGGCGKQGVLDRPAPLFGSRARAEYDADRQAAAQQAADDQARRNAGQAVSSATDPVQEDNAPLTTRDVRDPAQMSVPASVAPIPGAPTGPGGPPPSVRPMN